MLHLTSGTSIRDPGFSKSECLELARKLDSGSLVLSDGCIECEGCGNFLDSDEASALQTMMMIAALRAYADV